jgi:hypothetical protein
VKLAKLAGAPGCTVMLMGEVGRDGYGQQYRQQRQDEGRATCVMGNETTR